MRKNNTNGVTSNPKVLHGKACIKGTRIPVYLVLQMLSGGQSKNQILKEYPQLKEEDINSAIEYGAHLATQEIELQF
ncbi:MAG: DUF433 domain-containing protein [Candidatus Melainabacteria bacterium]|nr:DUF433 domain-containing protein [Candidatus Melainabacteria bacterium]